MLGARSGKRVGWFSWSNLHSWITARGVTIYRYIGISQHTKQNLESTEGYSRWKVEKRYGKFGKNWSQQLEHKKSPKGGRNQVSGSVSVPCWLATPVANAPWKPLVIRWSSNPVSRSWNYLLTKNLYRISNKTVQFSFNSCLLLVSQQVLVQKVYVCNINNHIKRILTQIYNVNNSYCNTSG